jgi:hypothetical protein
VALTAGAAALGPTAVANASPAGKVTYSVTVDGNNPSWTSTGIYVPAGSTLQMSASGRITYNLEDQTSGPNGFPVPTVTCASGVTAGWAQDNLPCLSLIGVLAGPSGQDFEVGTAMKSKPTEAGTLYLRYNDNLYTDNSGAFDVSVTVSGPGVAAPATSQAGSATPSLAGSTTYDTSVAGSDSSLTDTGIYVPEGRTVTIKASGLIAYNLQGQTSGPNGLTVPTETCAGGLGGSGWYNDNLRCLSLLGQLGNGEVFQLGTSTTIHDAAGGELYLVYNDNNYGDNSGSYSVAVTIS